MHPIATIGYQSDTLDGVIAKLKAAKVEVVIDVRAIASSRRAGFSKTLLAASLEAEGIDYRHLRALGTPKPGRDAAHKGHIAEMHAIYLDHLHDPEAQAQLAEAGEIALARPAALLCFEADAAGCHRRIVADRLSETIGCSVVDL